MLAVMIGIIPELGGTARSGGQDQTKDQEKGGGQDAGSTTEAINQDPKEDHAEDLADQVGVGEARLDGGGHGIFVAGEG